MDRPLIASTTPMGQDRALLDVQLDVARDRPGRPGGIADPVQVAARLVQCLPQGPAVAVGDGARVAGVDLPHDGERPEERIREMRALLVGEGDRDRFRCQFDVVPGEHPQHLVRCHHAVGAVQPAAVPDGVDVRSDQHDRPRRIGSGTSDHQVARLVGARHETVRAALLGQVVASRVLLSGQSGAGDARAGRRAEPGDLGEPAQHRVAVDPQVRAGRQVCPWQQ
jgi:hypothetical protein